MTGEEMLCYRRAVREARSHHPSLVVRRLAEQCQKRITLPKQQVVHRVA